MHSSAAAEKGDEGMALKNRSRAEDMLDGFFLYSLFMRNIREPLESI
jgi:hypothetical protein